MSFDCVIPTYNNCEELQWCLDGFRSQTLRPERVIVCVDGSTDGTLEYLQHCELPCELIVCQHNDRQNHGRNAARNLAIPYLQSRFVCFCDSDMQPHATMLEQHALLLHERRCVSVGDVRYTNAHTNAWSAYAQSRGKNKYRHGDEIPYYYLATGNCAMESQLFLAVEGQDAHMKRYGGGDTELGIRLRKQFAVSVVFNARSVVSGTMDKSLDQALQQLEEFGRTNLHYIHQKHPDVTDIFYLHSMIGTSVRARMFRLLLQPMLTRVCVVVAPYLPHRIRRYLINYAVIQRIWQGWRRG